MQDTFRIGEPVVEPRAGQTVSSDQTIQIESPFPYFVNTTDNSIGRMKGR
jgi:hypothetical protein